MNPIALCCVAALGLLVFGLGFAVSGMRAKHQQLAAVAPDPGDILYRLVRAHGNTTEFAPFLAVLMLYLGANAPAAWVIWTMVAVTVCRYLFVAGLVLFPTMARPNFARFVGASGTYFGGFALCVALLQTIQAGHG